MNVELKWITPNAEKEILYIARVSSPNPDSENTKLIDYLIKHRHWSPFEMANMCLSIETSRAISAQILRHKSFSFQEFSQRYGNVQKFEVYDARRQDEKNRQNSIDDLSDNVKQWFLNTEINMQFQAIENYHKAISLGIAKESARFLLPMTSQTHLYMNGTIRSWTHYLQERTSKDAQLEHRLVAEKAKEIFIKELPIISKALEWV